MPKKKTDTEKRTSVSVGNLSGISGNVNIAGGNISTHQTINGLNAAEIKQLFDQVYQSIETRPATSPANKEDFALKNVRFGIGGGLKIRDSKDVIAILQFAVGREGIRGYLNIK